MFMTQDRVRSANGEQAAANFLADVQLRLLALMDAKGVSRAELASRLGVARSRVTRMLGADSNLTVATLGRVFDALGEVPEVTSPMIRAVIDEARFADISEEALRVLASEPEVQEEVWASIPTVERNPHSGWAVGRLEFANAYVDEDADGVLEAA